MRQIVPSSTLAMQTRYKYPWNDMEVGQSFQVAYGEAKLSSLKPYAYRMGQKLNKKFNVVDHGEAIGYEVARVK